MTEITEIYKQIPFFCFISLEAFSGVRPPPFFHFRRSMHFAHNSESPTHRFVIHAAPLLLLLLRRFIL